MALMPSSPATRFTVFNTLYIKLHDSNHWWSQCQNITGMHSYNTAHSLCSGGWFRAVFQPYAACSNTMVSKRLQSALYAGAEALIQTANAPVSHHSLRMGRGRSGFMDLKAPCGASKAIGCLQKTARLLLRWLCHREDCVQGYWRSSWGIPSSLPHEWVYSHSVHLHSWKSVAHHTH